MESVSDSWEESSLKLIKFTHRVFDTVEIQCSCDRWVGGCGISKAKELKILKFSRSFLVGLYAYFDCCSHLSSKEIQ